MGKAFVIDVAKCSGCHGCQVVCKDEHCEQSWLPIAEAQPLTGSFWCEVREHERGKTPVVTVAYTPVMCNHCDKCALIAKAPDAVYRRDDGLVIIDPVKAKGRKDLVDACPLGCVYWNETLELPQKCTGCAHLLDDGWSVPRCVDACAHEAILFGEEEELDLEGTEFYGRMAALGPHVYYRNLPKRFAAGCVYDPELGDIVEGALVTLTDAAGNVVATQRSDFLGDWKFDQIEPAAYHVHIQAVGYKAVYLDIDTTDEDVVTPDAPLTFIGEESLRTREVYDPPRSLHSRERKPVVYDDDEDDDGFITLTLGTKFRELFKYPEAMDVIADYYPQARDMDHMKQFAALSVRQFHNNGHADQISAEQLSEIGKRLAKLKIEKKKVWSTKMKVAELAANDEAAAVIESVMPGLLSNEEVMGKVGGMSFKALGGMAPDQFTPELLDALEAGFAELNREKIVLNMETKVSVLAENEYAASALSEVMPGFLENDSVMSQVGGMSFKALGGMAPDKFTPELLGALEGALSKAETKANARWHCDVVLDDLAKNRDTLAVVEKYYPGLLTNGEVMGQIGRMSFKKLSAMKPESFEPETVATLDDELCMIR